MGSLPLTNLFLATYKKKRHKGGGGYPRTFHTHRTTTRSPSPSAQDLCEYRNAYPAISRSQMRK